VGASDGIGGRTGPPYRVRREINEGTSLALAFNHYDMGHKARTVISEAAHTSGTDAPTSVRWRLDNLDTLEAVADWQTVSAPSGSNTITLTATQHTLRGTSRTSEMLQLTVEAVVNGKTAVDVYTYRVASLLGVERA